MIQAVITAVITTVSLPQKTARIALTGGAAGL